MGSEVPTWDYIFASDLHVSLGYDRERRAYHPREDFFFDEVFFRWLRWLDSGCAPGHRLELVVVGDFLDFLPADRQTVARYLRERQRRSRGLDIEDSAQIVRYWEGQFSRKTFDSSTPESIQRLMFEDDVLDGRVQLELRPRHAPKSAIPDRVQVPLWAVQVFSRYNPRAYAESASSGVEWRLGPRSWSADGGTAKARDATTREELSDARDLSSAADRPSAEDFEGRYGFLPTPEKSARKLDAIYEGHPILFRALAWFVGLGHRLAIVRGNHDLEFYWPIVQETFRGHIAREYEAAFSGTDNYDPESRALPDMEDRIQFQPGWFYYRRGVFYAEHGCQYDPMTGSANPVRPLLPCAPWVMNPDVGSLGVTCLHNHLEDRFPELENEADYGMSLISLVRQQPVRLVTMLIRHAADFMRMAQRLWLAGNGSIEEQRPSQDDFAYCAGPSGMTPELVREVYELGSTPLLLRRRLAWFLFSPWGHAAKLACLAGFAVIIAGLLALYYLVLVPAFTSLLPAGFLFTTVGAAFQLLAKVLLWLVPPAAYAAVRRKLGESTLHDPLFAASARIQRLLQERDPGLRFVIMGHSHRPDVRPVALRSDGRDSYHINTGTWTPTFSEGRRRLQTLGREVEFTFLRLVATARGYEADLLRWNDDAGRAERQAVPPAEA